MQNKIRVSIITYQNSIPYQYGLENYNYDKSQFLFLKDIPSQCAQKLLNNEADAGIVPIAVIPKLCNFELFEPFGILSKGNVRTVTLFSEVPLTEIEEIYLDYQSRTSVMLVKILAEKYWNINVKWINAEIGYEKNIKEKTAGLIIGDRVFENENKFKFSFDLAKEWQNFTQLPFVFASWVINKNISAKHKSILHNALSFGLNHIPESVKSLNNNLLSNSDLINYLNINIKFIIDDESKKAMNLFLSYLNE